MMSETTGLKPKMLLCALVNIIRVYLLLGGCTFMYLYLLNVSLMSVRVVNWSQRQEQLRSIV